MKLVNALILGGAGLVAAFLVYRKVSTLAADAASGAANAVQQAAWAVTPWNNDNVIYGGVNSVGATVTGNNDFSLGSWIYDVTHPEPPTTQPPQKGVTGYW